MPGSLYLWSVVWLSVLLLHLCLLWCRDHGSRNASIRYMCSFSPADFILLFMLSSHHLTFHDPICIPLRQHIIIRIPVVLNRCLRCQRDLRRRHCVVISSVDFDCAPIYVLSPRFQSVRLCRNLVWIKDGVHIVWGGWDNIPSKHDSRNDEFLAALTVSIYDNNITWKKNFKYKKIGISPHIIV